MSGLISSNLLSKNLISGGGLGKLSVISVVEPTNPEGASSTTATVAIPNTIKEGDILVAYMLRRSAITDAAGFTLIVSQKNGGFDQWTDVYYKTAVTADVGSTKTFTQASAVRFAVGLIVLRSTTSTFYVNGYVSNGQTAAPVIPPYSSVADSPLYFVVSSNAYANTPSSAGYYISGTNWVANEASTVQDRRICAGYLVSGGGTVVINTAVVTYAHGNILIVFSANPTPI